MRTTRILVRLRRENVDSELALLRLMRRRPLGNAQVEALFEAVYGDIIHYAVDEYAKHRLTLMHVGMALDERRELCLAMRDRVCRYLRAVEQRWRASGTWRLGRQWRRVLSTVSPETGRRQSLRFLVEWFANEYCRYLLRRHGSQDDDAGDLQVVQTEDDLDLGDTLDGEAEADAGPRALVSSVGVIERRERKPVGSGRRDRGRRRASRRDLERTAIELELPGESLQEEIALLDLQRKQNARHEVDITFDKVYGDLVAGPVGEYARLRLLVTHAPMSYRDQLRLCRHIRRRFWQYVRTVESHWRAEGHRSARRRWRQQLSEDENGHRRTLRSIVEWFVDEYCRHRFGRRGGAPSVNGAARPASPSPVAVEAAGVAPDMPAVANGGDRLRFSEFALGGPPVLDDEADRRDQERETEELEELVSRPTGS